MNCGKDALYALRLAEDAQKSVHYTLMAGV